jgi:hypothetical protein
MHSYYIISMVAIAWEDVLYGMHVFEKAQCCFGGECCKMHGIISTVFWQGRWNGKVDRLAFAN